MGLSSTSPSPAPCLEILSPLPESRLSMSSLVNTAILKGSSPARLIPLCTRPWLSTQVRHRTCSALVQPHQVLWCWYETVRQGQQKCSRLYHWRRSCPC